MEKSTREKIALAMLVALGVLAAIAMGWYIFVGHNWNIAALHIDDYVGEMERYTVIVYDGVLPRHEEVAQLIDADPNTSRPEASEGGGEVKEVTAAAVAADYLSKDASVLLLHTDDTARYRDPVILKCGDQRIGIFSIGGKYQFGKIRTSIAYLKSHAVDKVVIVSEDSALRKTQVFGADLVVFACDAAIKADGEYVGSVFYVDSPDPEEARAVIIAPNNMMTAKTVVSL